MAEPEKKPEVPATKKWDIGLGKGLSLMPRNFEEALNFCQMIAKTDFVPKSFRDQPGSVLAAIQYGSEVGLPPMACLQSIAVTNGRPSLHSDGYWAIIVTHPQCEWFEEDPPHKALEQGYGRCVVKRRSNPHPTERRFSIADAKTAKLLDKDNWKMYPGTMLMWRARHMAGDGAIPEASQGLIPSIIAEDLEPRDVTPKPEPRKIEPPRRKTEAEPAAEMPQELMETIPDEQTHSSKPPERDDQPPPERDSVPPGHGTGAEKAKKPTDEERKAAALKWIAEVDDAEFLANKDFLTTAIKGLKIVDQNEICLKHNQRRRSITDALKG